MAGRSPFGRWHDGIDAGQLRGVVVCAAGNLCMRCAIKIAAARARQIELLAAVMKALGFHCYMAPRPSPTPAATAWPSATRT